MAVITYYNDQKPDAATLSIIAARGDTVAYIDRPYPTYDQITSLFAKPDASGSYGAYGASPSAAQLDSDANVQAAYKSLIFDAYDLGKQPQFSLKDVAASAAQLPGSITPQAQTFAQTVTGPAGPSSSGGGNTLTKTPATPSNLPDSKQPAGSSDLRAIVLAHAQNDGCYPNCNADQWGYYYNLYSDAPAPAPEDLGYSRPLSATPFDVWWSKLQNFISHGGTGSGGSGDQQPAKKSPMKWLAIGIVIYLLAK